jgi:hypothetical protein
MLGGDGSEEIDGLLIISWEPFSEESQLIIALLVVALTEVAECAMVVPLREVSVLLNCQFKQFERLADLPLLVDALSLLEVVEFKWDGGVDAAEVVRLRLLQLLPQTAADRLPLYLEKLLPLH